MMLTTNGRTGWTRLAGVLAVVVLMLGIGVSAAEAGPVTGKVYWGSWSAGQIGRANLDGSGVEVIVDDPLLTLTSSPRGLDFDLAAGKVYWTNQTGPRGLHRANLDGTEIEVASTLARGNGAATSPWGLAIDPLGGFGYVVSVTFDNIWRVNLGSGAAEPIIEGAGAARSLAVDPLGGKLYWGARNSQKIQRANLDGTGVEDLVTTGVLAPYGLSLDLGAGKMYWTDRDAGNIQRANLDGSGVEELVSGLGQLREIDLDTPAGKMYWSDTGLGIIQRANLDGSGVETIVTGLGTTYSLGVIPVPEPATLSLLALGGLALLRRRRVQ